MSSQPVLEVGGTHVSASRVNTSTWQQLARSSHRLPLDSSGSAEAIIAKLADCARRLGPMSGDTLAVAIPGPFDYAAGIGRFRDVGKFDALADVDVGLALVAQLPEPPQRITFVNDTAAFALGEWLGGAARRYQRAVAITLGTGVGSAFLDGGKIISHGKTVPPSGHVHRLLIAGRPLEDTVSRRALIAAYCRRARNAAPDLDVHDIAALAQVGDDAASHVLTEAFHQLGVALAPWLTRFGAEVLVVGGGLTASWQLVDEPLRSGLGSVARNLAVVKSVDAAAAVAVGAAWHSSGLAPAVRITMSAADRVGERNGRR
jgi:glucokinase